VSSLPPASVTPWKYAFATPVDRAPLPRSWPSSRARRSPRSARLVRGHCGRGAARGVVAPADRNPLHGQPAI